ncbi:hypothetical protein RhiirA5_429456 [Rhizophagus irregularis]|nr:hypothetical protein RhiirA5_429456 [Rhizophagus irregularis]
MVMLCICLAELKTLCIVANGKVTGYVKNRNQEDLPQVFRSMEKSEERARQLLSWVQNAISSRQLRDPSIAEVKWLNTFLKNHDLLPCKIEIVFVVVVHEAKNLSNAITITSEALWHSPDNNTSPV